MYFKDWLSQNSPEGAGDIWTSRSNADPNFQGLKSKYFANSVDKNNDRKDFNPEKTFGKTKKSKKK